MANEEKVHPGIAAWMKEDHGSVVHALVNALEDRDRFQNAARVASEDAERYKAALEELAAGTYHYEGCPEYEGCGCGGEYATEALKSIRSDAGNGAGVTRDD